MRLKIKRIIIIIALLLVTGIVFGFNHKIKNKEEYYKTIVEVEGELSINFINGKKVTKDGTYEFSITNNGDKNISYDITITNLKKHNSNITYTIYSPDITLNINNKHLEKDNFILINNLSLGPKITNNFILTVNNLDEATFTIDIRKVEETEEFFANTIIENNEIKKTPTTKPAEELATTNEGLIEDIDDLGTTYYFRGNITNNYVNFASLIWRIVRINGDGTIRLILDTATTELSNYHDDEATSEDFQNSNIYKHLLSYFEINLKNYSSYIANSKFCIETGNTTNSTGKIYNPYNRIATNHIPTFNCLGSKFNSKIGLLTADEVVYAGANLNEDNKEYYLYNSTIESIWWTSSLAKTSGTTFYPFSVTPNGKLSTEANGSLYRDIRPVINIIKKSTVKGKGTIDEPYTLNE